MFHEKLKTLMEQLLGFLKDLNVTENVEQLFEFEGSYLKEAEEVGSEMAEHRGKMGKIYGFVKDLETEGID